MQFIVAQKNQGLIQVRTVCDRKLFIIVKGQLEDDVEELFTVIFKEILCRNVPVHGKQEIDKAREAFLFGVVNLGA